MTEKGTKNQDINVKTMKGFKEVSPEYKAISRKEVFREFWASARSQKRIFLLLLFFVVLQGGVVGGSIWLVKTALDLFFENKDPKGALFLIGALFMATVMKNSLEFLFNWKKMLTIGRIRDELVVKAFRDLIYNPFHFHIRERDRKKYAWVLNDATSFIESVFSMFNSWVKQPFMLASTICALMIIAPFLTLVGIVLIPLGIPCVLFFKRKTKEFIAQRRMLLGIVEEMVSETIRGIRIVKVFGLEEREVKRLQQTVSQQRNISERNAFFVGLMSPVSEFLGLFGLSVIIFVGSQDILSGAFTTGTFFVFIMSFLNIYRPLKDVSNGIMKYQLALDSGRRLIILRQNALKERKKIGTVPIEHFKDLRIEKLWFSYAEKPKIDDEYILRNLTFTIRRGETVAIVGATGAGKSTLCDLIVRLYRPQRGTACVNGIPLDRIENQSCKKIFSLCSQETIVFNNTLLEDIRIARPEASREEVLTISKAVGLTSYMNSLNRGLDTWIGDRGVHCSGGQRQLIALARALLQKPEVLILDEAMSGVDVEMARMIWQNIREGLPGCTILVISHHWHLIKHCDRVVVLSEGRIVKDTPVEAIEDKDRFFREFHLEKDNSVKEIHVE